MQPRKDYEDYTKFINDTYPEEKTKMLNNTIEAYRKTGDFHKGRYNPMDTLKSNFKEDLSKTSLSHRNFTKGNSSLTPNEQALGATLTDFNVRPKILEAKFCTRNEFFGLSDGFKKILSLDK